MPTLHAASRASPSLRPNGIQTSRQLVSGTSRRCVAASSSGTGASAPTPADGPNTLTRRGALLLIPTVPGLTRLVAAATVAGTAAIAAPLPAAAAGGGVAPSPEVKAAVDRVIDKIITKSKTLAPVSLRLAYHDAGTFSKKAGDGGINASIRFELERPENFGLKRGWKLIEQAKAELKGTPAEGVVSSADLIAWAGARAVAVTGGPDIPVVIGRADADGPDPPGRMASEKSDARTLIANFADKGFSVRELVALSGAHTIGGKGFGDPVTFDNAYYTSLLAKPWLNTSDPMADHIGLPSDHALPDDPECLAIIKEYAADNAAFKRDFASAYQKLVTTGVTWRDV